MNNTNTLPIFKECKYEISLSTQDSNSNNIYIYTEAEPCQSFCTAERPLQSKGFFFHEDQDSISIEIPTKDEQKIYDAVFLCKEISAKLTELDNLLNNL